MVRICYNIFVAHFLSWYDKIKEHEMNQTSMLKTKEVVKKWYIIDAKNLVLGRLASKVALILRGKNKPSFTPHIDCGDYVIITNASHVKLTGSKYNDKKYYHHSQYPGGLKVRTYKDIVAKKPTYPVERAVRLMLPKGTLGRQQFRHLFVYAGDKHPHAPQQPIELKFVDDKIIEPKEDK